MYGNILNYMEIHGNLSTRNSDENKTYWYVNVSQKELGFRVSTANIRRLKGLNWFNQDKTGEMIPAIPSNPARKTKSSVVLFSHEAINNIQLG